MRHYVPATPGCGAVAEPEKRQYAGMFRVRVAQFDFWIEQKGR